jgi:hypothetical protein
MDAERQSSNSAISDDNRQRINHTSADPFTKEQLEFLEKLFSQNSTTTGSSMAAQKGTESTDKQDNSEPWVIDSGASNHMTGDKTVLHEYSESKEDCAVKVADGTLSKIEGTGRSRISKDMILKSVLYVPNLDCNLLSISKLTRDLKCMAKFFPNFCVFQDLASGKRIGSARMYSGLYLLKNNLPFKCKAQNAVLFNPKGQSVFNTHKDSNVMLWHYRLGHPNFVYLEKLLPSLFINKSSKTFSCEICQFSKHTRSNYPSITYKSSKPFALIHSDVWGPSKVQNISGTRWFVSFVDDHTRITWLFLMKEKSEVGTLFRNFNSMIQTQFQTKIQVLKTDNAKEYFNTILGSYLLNQGIIHISSCVDTPQQNGVAERKNRHLLEVARSLMFSTNVPKHFWGEAVLTATYLINRMPSRVLKFQTPYQTLLTAFPHIKFLSNLDPKIFGCSVFVHVHQTHRSKLDPRSIKCIFIGYSSNHKGYKCYSPTTKRVYHSLDVTFFEHQAYYPTSDIQGENIREY